MGIYESCHVAFHTFAILHGVVARHCLAKASIPCDVARFLCLVLACASSFICAAMAAFGLATQFQYYGYTGSFPAAHTLPSAALRLA